MQRDDVVSRRQFLVAGSAGALALATSQAAAQAPAQTLHVKPVPSDVFIDHGINQETRLETLRGYLTPSSHFFVRQHSNVPAIDLRTWFLFPDINHNEAARTFGAGLALQIRFE